MGNHKTIWAITNKWKWFIVCIVCCNHRHKFDIQFNICNTFERYCASLPSGQKTVLTPHWTTEEILDLNDVDEKYLRHLKNVPGMRKSKYYQSRLSLPLNSPLRCEVIGQVMATKQLARQMVALDTCIRLHELNELDDQHLLPASKESKKAQPELTTTSKKISADAAIVYESFYRKASPVAFVNCMPQTNHDNYLYVLDYDLVQGIPQSKSSFDIENLQWKLGLLTSKALPRVNAFPIFTKVCILYLIRFWIVLGSCLLFKKLVD